MPVTKKTRIRIKVEGIGTGMMFDKYPGDNKTQLLNKDKFYRNKENQIVVPKINLVSFLTAENTTSATKLIFERKEYKRVARAFATHLIIEEEEIVLQRDGKPIVFGDFNSDNIDPSSGMFVHHAVARLAKGVPNPKQRPVLPCPWSAEFHVTLMPTKQLQIEDVRRVFDEGGAICGWGTFRPYFGRFQIVEFDVEKK